MKKAILPMLVILLGLPAHSALAAGWQIGGGGQFVDFDDDLDGIDSGFGGIFSAAYRQSEFIGFDFQVGVSGHEDDDLDEDAGYAYGMAGIKLFLSTADVVPYLAAGISVHSVAFDDADTISGEGLYFGVGADFKLSARHSLNISYRVSEWDGEDDDNDYDVGSTYFGVAYNFHFTPQ